MKRALLILMLALPLCGFTTCGTAPTPKAASTAPIAASPLPVAIDNAAAAEKAARDAQAKQASTAAASVAGLRAVNSASQPAGQATEFVDGEAGVALANLPAPDPAAALEVEKRRAAVFAGERDAARKLYTQAQSDAQKLAAATTEANARADAAQSALAKAQQDFATQLEANRQANQRAIDAERARADRAVKDAQDKARAEQRRLITLLTFGLGALFIAGGVVVLLTSASVPMFGPKAGFALIGAGGALVALGIAITQIENFLELHPWVTGGALGLCALAAAVAAALMWANHHHAAGTPSPAHPATL